MDATLAIHFGEIGQSPFPVFAAEHAGGAAEGRRLPQHHFC